MEFAYTPTIPHISAQNEGVQRRTVQRLSVLYFFLFLIQGLILCYSLWLAQSLLNLQPSNQTTTSLTKTEQWSPSLESISEPTEAIAPASLAIKTTAPTTKNETRIIGKGDTLAAVWSSLGAPYAGAIKAQAALKSINKHTLKLGEKVEFTLNSNNDVIEMHRRFSNGSTLTLTGNATEGYTATVQEPEVKQVTLKSSGTIKSSLASAARDIKIPFSVVDDFVDLFGSRVEFRRDLQPGDTFTIEYTQTICEKTGEIINPGVVLSASLKTQARLMAAIQYIDTDNKVRYYNESGNPLGNYFLRYPVQFTRISSAFSYARFHPILQRARPHNGVDFAAPEGTPVRSVADGVIESAGYQREAGNMIRVSHGDRYATAYLHLSQISSGLKAGSRVVRGQVIGAVGSTGLATGPHLHFSLYDRGIYVDPMKAELPNTDQNIKPLPKQFLLAALEALDMQHKNLAKLNVLGPEKNLA